MSFLYSTLLIIATIFIGSSISKLLHLQKFISGVKEYEILPDKLVTLFSISTILVEVFISYSYLFQKFISIASLCALILLLVYSLAIIISLIRKKDMNCHCFESFGSSKLTLATLTRVILLILLNTYIYVNSGLVGIEFKSSLGDTVLYGLLTITLLLSNELVQKGLETYKQVVKEYGN